MFFQKFNSTDHKRSRSNHKPFTPNLSLFFSALYLLLISILCPLQNHAEEVDDFTNPHRVPKDAAPVINAATRSLLDELVDLLNQSPLANCQDPQRYVIALKKLDQNFTAIGNGLRAGPELKQILLLLKSETNLERITALNDRLKVIQDVWLAEFPPSEREGFTKLFSSIDYFGLRQTKDSIYDGIEFPTCCTSRINVNGTYVGLDKIDHFFGNGGLLFEQLQFKEDANLPLTDKLYNVMLTNINQEHTLWGLNGLSPKSYADMAANWQGVHFYQDLFDHPPQFIQCTMNRMNDGLKPVFFKNKNSTFKIENYLDESWNESINCPSFGTTKDFQAFQQNLAKKHQQCPINPSLCEHLKEQHSSDPLFVDHALSPLCSGKPANFLPVEEPIPIPWDDVKLAFRGFTWPIIKDLIRTKATTIVSEWIPSAFITMTVEEGQRTFKNFKDCELIADQNAKEKCVKQFIPKEVGPDQVFKFTTALQHNDFSEAFICPAASLELEDALHSEGIGDFDLCFNHERPSNHEALGRVYFKRINGDLKIVLLRF